MKNCIGLRDLLVEEFPHIKIGIVTNGLRLDERWTEVMLKHGYLTQFSLNGSNKTIYDRTMRFGQYEKVMENLDRLLKLRREMDSPLKIATSFVIVPENVCDMAEYVEFAADRGIDKVLFFTDQMLSPASADTEGTLREIDRAYEAIAAHPDLEVDGLESFELLYRQRHGLMGQDPAAAERCKESRAQELCQIPWTQIYVKHRGEVTVCCMSWRTLGNLHEKSIEEVWNGPRARDFRRKMLQDNFVFCSPTCLANRRPDFSWVWSARKFAYQVAEDPDLIWKKAKNKLGKMRQYRKDAPRVDSDFPSVQKKKA